MSGAYPMGLEPARCDLTTAYHLETWRAQNAYYLRLSLPRGCTICNTHNPTQIPNYPIHSLFSQAE